MPKSKVCPKPGCPEIIPRTERYCPDHEREYEQQRGSASARGYDAEHRRLRREWERKGVVGRPCARCKKPILAHQAWDLGHTDDRKAWTGPEHAACNRSAGGRAAHGM